ncbi:STAS domain-containing protein [Bacillus sp. FJAT-44742]|uniref:STAS domain-containing protein n=1 Tax=Bacillus sp. FJAT-44742 TaxID=2014005 RepID=UPI000C2483B0|nr:STAS domain-containing protein [Bacillus sp. FJAT-44742]
MTDSKGSITSNPSIAVNDVQFNWDTKEGRFQFAGNDVVLFWIESAMKSFLDTIQEVSGDEAAEVVLETTGYRMGTNVSDFFKQTNVEEVVKMLPKVYGAAGWGKVTFKEFSVENKTAVIQVKDSWEYKVMKEQGKNRPGLFLPGHWAGVLSGLFEDNIWYKINKSQILGDEYSEYIYNASSITPSQNIHDLSRKEEQSQISKLEEMVLDRTKELSNLVKEISSPLIPVLDDIVVIPLLGSYDENRSNELLEKTLSKLPEFKARYLILDLTGLHGDVNEYTIALIHKLTETTSLLGTESILVGMSPELSIQMTKFGFRVEEKKLHCFSTLKHAIFYSLSQQGKQII